MSLSGDFMVIPCYRKVSKEFVLERAVIFVGQGHLGKALGTIMNTLTADSREAIENIYVSKVSGERYVFIITFHSSLKNKLHDILHRLVNEHILDGFHIIEPIEAILPIYGFLFVNEDGLRLRTFTTGGFVGIFINLLSLLGEQGEFVIERIGYYLGRSHVEALFREGILQEKSVFKAIGYSLLTGVSFGLYRLVGLGIKRKGLVSIHTEIKIKIKDYYEEEEYRKAGINKCSIYQKGFFKGIVEFFIGDKNYIIEEPICYNSERESLFVIELPVDITKEERDFLSKISSLALGGKANKP
jgi:hypothetical protein